MLVSDAGSVIVGIHPTAMMMWDCGGGGWWLVAKGE